jgi:hypothetical protein
MNSFLIKLNENEKYSLIKMIKDNDDFFNKDKIIGQEELISFTENLLEQNIKCNEFLKKIEFNIK